ncbi:hypothetical protein NP233_g11484 [Leucocoprinus birnbaumii]|uniref:Uncharacterized protein n=1 Tax=Leucocoprinus birnbaumii TaxID=56174 RepID=A0AAD5YQX8_9AGAR|nr:hypothetical protein NP233_g11484 [Leucocoprinus birnbaumii]
MSLALFSIFRLKPKRVKPPKSSNIKTGRLSLFKFRRKSNSESATTSASISVSYNATKAIGSSGEVPAKKASKFSSVPVNAAVPPRLQEVSAIDESNTRDDLNSVALMASADDAISPSTQDVRLLEVDHQLAFELVYLVVAEQDFSTTSVEGAYDNAIDSPVLQENYGTQTTHSSCLRLTVEQAEFLAFLRKYERWPQLGHNDMMNSGSGLKFHQTSPRCFPGTRSKLLQRLKTWLNSSTTIHHRSNLTWLTGPAGAGKTAVVYRGPKIAG